MLKLNKLLKSVRYILLVSILCSALPAHSQQKVTLQLKWTHAFQFAGYYAAKEQGFYSEAGLDVTILEANPETNPVENVLNGKAQYGVGTSSLLLERKAGKPVVVLAVIFQHSPYEIYAAAGIHNLHDLVGKRLMLEPQSEEILAYLKKEGVPLDSIHLLPHTFDVNSMIEGKVDAMSGYVSNEPYYFRQAQYPFQIFSPRSAGIDFYGDNLFTSQQELDNHPERVEAFRAATLRGWQYAETHRDKVIDLILSKYSQKHTRDYLHFESDQMIPLLQPDLVEIGYMNPHRWQHIANTYADIGLLPVNYNIDGFIYNADAQELYLFYNELVVALVVIILISSLAFYIYRVNRRLRVSIDRNKQTTAALAESEELWRTIVKTSPDGIAIASIDGTVKLVSDKIYTMYGYTSPDQMLGRNIIDSMDSAYHAAVKEMISNLLQGNHTGIVEHVAIRKDGSRFFAEGNAEVLRDIEGNPKEIFFIVRDIDKRKQIEKALKESEERYKTFVSQISEGVYRSEIIPPMPMGLGVEEQVDYLYDHEYIAECNASFLKMYGIKDEKDIIGKGKAELHGSRDIPENRKSLIRFINAEYRIDNAVTKEKDTEGNTIYVSNNALGIFDNGCLIRMWGTQSDITARKKAEDALRFQSEIVENIAEGVFLVTSSDDIIVYTNPTFDRMYGYEPGELTGTHVKTINPNDEMSAATTVLELRESLVKKGSWNGEVLNIKKDGTLFWCHANITGYEHPEYGHVWVSVHQDITDRKLAEAEVNILNDQLEQRVIERTAQLQAANNELETFSYTASHDLRTPLRALDGFANILLQDYAPSLDAEGKRLLNVIIENANRMGFLIDDLLSFSRLGRQEIITKRTDMFSMADSVYQELAHEKEKPGIEFRLQQLPEAFGDPAMMRQLWINLIGNAIKFSSKKKHRIIEIGTINLGDENVYFVKDNGSGFDMTRSNKLFGVFQRLHSPKDYEGTGVGLAIVQRIIQRHKGRVWAEAKVDEGATFYFTLGTRSE